VNHPNIKTQSILVFMLMLAIALSFPNPTQAAPVVPPQNLEQIENQIQTGSAGIATGDPDGPHARYGWPFTVDQVGHLDSSYQLYSSDLNDAYFHHGIDILADFGTQVRTPVAGQVVNVENYNYGSELYWEVAILDPEGYVWQYHHLDQPTIPSAIYTAFQAYQNDPVNGGFIPANSHLGNIVNWPVESFGYYFHHIHLNILADGDVYLNPLEFLDYTHVDTDAPEVQRVGLFTGTNTLLDGNTIPFGTDYSLFIRTRDLFMSDVYFLPPHRITFELDGDPQSHTVWDFHTLPGGSSDTDFVNQYFLPGLTHGDYDSREFYIDLGFARDGNNPLPTDPGVHTIDIKVWDYSYNRATWKYIWTITQPLADNGCGTGQGVSYSYEVTADAWIEDLDLGVMLAHPARGDVRVTLKGPMDTSPVTLIGPSADSNSGYNLKIDDASTLPINDGNRDDLTPPSYKRNVGPQSDGSLDAYTGSNARGTWQVFVCDSIPGNSGAVHDLELFLTTSINPPQLIFLPMVTRGE
jgi:subtilisin-like proprotein convertase family protein